MQNKMQIRLAKTKWAKIAESWRMQYQKSDSTWQTTLTGDTEQIYKKLLALGDNPNPIAINEIIGNPSWTRFLCTQCQEPVDAVVTFGIDYETLGPAAEVCLSCVQKAIKLFQEKPTDER